MKELRRQNTRASKTLANEMVNSAWKIHLAKSCASSLVAMAAAEQQTSKLAGATRFLSIWWVASASEASEGHTDICADGF